MKKLEKSNAVHNLKEQKYQLLIIKYQISSYQYSERKEQLLNALNRAIEIIEFTIASRERIEVMREELNSEIQVQQHLSNELEDIIINTGLAEAIEQLVHIKNQELTENMYDIALMEKYRNRP